MTPEAKQQEVESPPPDSVLLSQQGEQKEQLLKTPEQAAPRPDKAAQG
jgi:hypothetical protein